MAADAEAANWDGLFVWDHVAFVKDWALETGDPWIILAVQRPRIPVGVGGTWPGPGPPGTATTLSRRSAPDRTAMVYLGQIMVVVS